MADLGTYKRKRNFAKTPEPKGTRATGGGNRFVIQKHAARRLHYDLRLELNGAFKSWAVTKGPSLVAGEKRLAVHVEDHPLEYGNFEGTIPKGEYGGGTVIVWDRGTWRPIGDAAQGYGKGHLEFELRGKKLGGRWHLVRMREKASEKRENWLLIKAADDRARPITAPDILEERPESVKTGREVQDVAAGMPCSRRKASARDAAPSRAKGPGTAKAKMASPVALKGARTAPLPAFVEPSLATLAKAPPEGPHWLHEIKFDGYRIQARIEAGRVKLLTRSGLDWTKKFGNAVVADFQALAAGKALIDGELVVENAAGASDFSALQSDLSEGKANRFAYYAFDLLYLDTDDLRAVPLHRRKEILKTLIDGAGGRHLRYSDHFEDSGKLVLSHACRLSLEGVVSKRRDAAYQSGRGKSWLKSQCSSRQEFVIAGYVPSSVLRRAIGSLVLGVYDGSKLRHVGRVGTGFSQHVAADLYQRLERIKAEESPFATRLTAAEAQNLRYVRPALVAEVEFRAWTGDGHLRHAAYRGLREDKPSRTIVREPDHGRIASKLQSARVKLTHPERTYWPDQGITKEGLANYYTDVWKQIAPFIVHRPLALLRGPEGIAGQMFFQKHAWRGVSAAIKLVKDPQDKAGEPLIVIEDLDGLVGLVQSATLEIHPWGAAISQWEKPDWLTMDLDPGEGVAWNAVITAARETRDRLRQAGLASFVKTSGGKGLHVVSPLEPKADWTALKSFTKGLAEQMAADSPARYVATITKSKRRGKILIDYLRNQRGMTAVAPYSTRARAGAAVSMPLAWDELGPAIGPAYFTVDNALTRLGSLKADPWAEFRSAAVPLKSCRLA